MDDFIGSGTVQNKTSGLEMFNVWAIPLPLLYCSEEMGSGELNEERGRGGGDGGGGEKAGGAGV